MRKKNSEVKLSFRHMAAELAKIADSLITTGHFQLAPGTYKAGEIHRILTKESKNYLSDGHLPSSIWTEATAPVDMRTLKEIWRKCGYTGEAGYVKIPLYNVFYALALCEKNAGLVGKKAYSFTLNDCREPVAETTLTFPNEKTMNMLSTQIRQFNAHGKKSCFISLRDGRLRGAFSEIVYVNAKKQVSEYNPFRVEANDFSPIAGTERVSLEINANSIKHMYGECKLRVYTDSIPTGPVTNPYNIRITVENADGWMVSTDTLRYFSDEQLARFDSQFSNSYEDDRVHCNDEFILTPEQPDSVLSIIKKITPAGQLPNMPDQGCPDSEEKSETVMLLSEPLEQPEDSHKSLTPMFEQKEATITTPVYKPHSRKCSLKNKHGRFILPSKTQ